MAHHRGRRAQDLRLRHPPLHPRVDGHRPELLGRPPVADRDQDVRLDRGERLERVAVELGEEVRARRLGAERDVDERAVAVARGGRGRVRVAEAGDRRRAGRVERRGREREQRGVAQRLQLLVGLQPGERPQLLQRPRGEQQRPRVAVERGHEVDAEAHLRHAEPLRGDRRGELHRLADDDVRPPRLDQREHAGQRRAAVHADEEVADHVGGVGLAPPDRRECLGDVRVAGGADGREGQAGALGGAANGLGAGDPHVVARAHAGAREREQRPEVAASARRREEDPHGQGTRRAAPAFPDGSCSDRAA